MKIPAPKLHSTGQAYVYWQGKTKYFGKYGSKQAETAFRQWAGELYGSKAPETRSALVVDLFADYIKAHPLPSLKDRYKAVSDLGSLAGHYCHEYTPLVYRKHREQIATTGSRCARHVNDLMRLVQRVFRWGASMEMCALEVYERLKTVDPLKAHEVKKQSTPRRPATRADVLSTLLELSSVPRAIIELILFTGARPGEICSIKASEITRAGPGGTWVYRPIKHKTGHHGKRRFVVFGPRGQKILEECWPTRGDYFFPAVLKVGYYKPDSLYQAVQHACDRAGVPRWFPYSLRHLRMTELAVDKGLETAAAVAGHGEIQTTRLYQHEPDILQLRGAV